MPHLPPASLSASGRCPRGRRPGRVDARPPSLLGISVAHRGAATPFPPLSNFSRRGRPRKRQPMAGASNYYKSRQAFAATSAGNFAPASPTAIPMDSAQYVTPSVSANRLRTSLERRETGGKQDGGGGFVAGEPAGGGGSRSWRWPPAAGQAVVSGLLDKVRSRSLGTVEACGARGVRVPSSHPLAPFLLRLLRESSRWPTVGTLTCACSQLPTYLQTWLSP